MEILLKGLKVLSDEKRLQIVQLLKECDSCSVSDLAEKLDCDQSAVSHCLATLHQIGLVKRQRQGKYVFYSLDRTSLDELKGMLFEQWGFSGRRKSRDRGDWVLYENPTAEVRAGVLGFAGGMPINL